MSARVGEMTANERPGPIDRSICADLAKVSRLPLDGRACRQDHRQKSLSHCTYARPFDRYSARHLGVGNS